ncbi:transglutaminase domain-containing protein [Methanobrevibacter sp. YE315]|uniref:transglutaminase domain-containing protein n=1 Tax=Methanobrevibacter sp. YE315 TaxID=1609968 RepID=UPI00082DDC3F|nr:transglutaminase domain-containing protein [Methanobrevibacter sp. YE315]
MNKQLLLTLLMVFTVLLSVSAVSASEISVTDSHTANLVDDTTDVSVPMEKIADSSVLSVSSVSNVDNDSSKVSLSSKEVLGSDYSNTLSTNSESNDLNDTIGVAFASGEGKISSGISDSIKAKDVTKYYKGSTPFSATFYDSNGNVLANRNVKITACGVDHTVKTNSRGIASLGIHEKPGTYQIISVNPVTGYKLTNTFKILSTISAADVSKVYADTRSFEATFVDSNGKPIANQNVKFNVNGKTYTVKTNANGLATQSLSNLPGGTFTMTSYNVDGLTKKNTIKVYNHVDTKLVTNIYAFYAGDTANVQVKLLNSFGYAPTTGKLVTLTVDGKKYSAKTNANGIAKFTLPKLANGGYVATYAFAGDEHYRASSAQNKIYFLPTKTLSLNVDGKTVFGKGSGSSFAVKLTSGDVPISNQYINFIVKGQTFIKVKTNSKGIASIPINLDVGRHTIKYSFNGTSDMKAVTGDTVVTVKERAETRIIWKSDSTFDVGTQQFKVALKNTDGVGIAKKTITLTVNSKTYTATTNSNGFATFNVNLPAGTYTVTYKFSAAGDEDYSGRTGTTKVTVKKKKETRILWKSATSFNTGTQQFKVALKNTEGIGIAKKVIALTVKSKTYTATTNSEGIATFNVNLPAGTYTVTYKFDGTKDSTYSGRTGTVKVTVKQKAETRILWKSATTFNTGTQQFKVALKTANGVGIAKKSITLTVNSNTYTAITNSEGIATFNVNLPAGSYTVSYKFDGTSDPNYSGRTGTTTIKVARKSLSGYGYWVFGADMRNVDLGSLASKGTTDIFLNYAAISKHGQSSVESWIASANKVGINVHIWMQAFYDGSWINPVKNGQPNTAYFNTKINEAKNYAKIKGVAGIHFDYLRYPGNAYKTSGGAAAVTQFAKQAASAIHAVNPNLIVSCAVMPETTSNVYYYGQDHAQLSKYMDVIIPMIYKGNYNQNSKWIATTTKWFVDNSNGAVIWSGLQGYVSDDDVSKLPVSQLKTDAQNALNGKAKGVVVFRWGVTNFIDFKSIDGDSDTSTSLTLAKIVAAATTLSNNIKSVDSIPTKVTIDGVDYSMPRFLYLMTRAVANINQGKTSAIDLVPASAPANPSGISNEATLSKADYVDVAQRVANFIVNNELAPNYASSTVGTIKYQSLVDTFARVLASYKANNKLPTSIKVNPTSRPSPSPEPVPPSGETVALKDIISAAGVIKTYYEKNTKLPSSVEVGSLKVTMQKFLYLLTKAVCQLDESNTGAVPLVTKILAPDSPSGDEIGSATLPRAGYVNTASNVASYIEKNNQAPNFASSDVGNIIFTELVDAYARIVAFYGSNKELPTYVTVRYSEGGSVDPVDEKGTGLNEKNTITNLKPYLVATTNCQVNNTSIKNIVDSLTKGLTSDYDIANALYKYVRDSISYSFYYDTRYGAVGTLNAKTGNCVDQAHLLVAMARTAGLPARYVHGTCHFSSGSTYGHVWAQILVGDMWTLSDPTSSRNSFGNVVNWNTNSFSLHSITSSIEF